MSIEKKQHADTNGFTLLETIVAVTLITATVVGPITLIARSLFSASFSRNDLIAYTLAQEGIELARAIRDNNILCGSLDGGATPWDEDPQSGGGPPTLRDYYTLDVLDNIALTSPACADIITPRPTNRNLSNCITTPDPLLIDAIGRYTYTAGTQSGFSRCVRVCSPPDVPPCSAVIDADIPANDQMEVISTVFWTERNSPKSVTLNLRLYKWE